MLTLCNEYKQDSMLFIQQELFICIKNASLLHFAVYRNLNELTCQEAIKEAAKCILQLIVFESIKFLSVNW